MVNFTPIGIGATGNAAMMNDPLDELDAVIENQRDGEIYGVASTLTISGGVVLITGGYHTIASESGIVDQLDTINGGVVGQRIMLQADTGDSIILGHNTNSGNIRDIESQNVVLSGSDIVPLLFDGLNWRTMRPGGNTSEVVQQTLISASVANINIINIPATESLLMLVLGLRSDVTGRDDADITFNGDTGANYYTLNIRQPIGASGLFEGRAADNIEQNLAYAGSDSPTGYLGAGVIFIPNYQSAAAPRNLAWQIYMQRGNPTGDLFSMIGGALWTNAVAAINQITITPGNGANWTEGFYALYALN